MGKCAPSTWARRSRSLACASVLLFLSPSLPRASSLASSFIGFTTHTHARSSHNLAHDSDQLPTAVLSRFWLGWVHACIPYCTNMHTHTRRFSGDIGKSLSGPQQCSLEPWPTCCPCWFNINLSGQASLRAAQSTFFRRAVSTFRVTMHAFRHGLSALDTAICPPKLMPRAP